MTTLELNDDDVEDVVRALEAYEETLGFDDSAWASEVRGNLDSLRRRILEAWRGGLH